MLRELGIWFVRPSRGLGFARCLGAVGKMSAFNLFEGPGAPRLVTAINTCLDDGIN